MSEIEHDAELLQSTNEPSEINPEFIDQPEDQPEAPDQPEEQAKVPFYRKKAFQLMGGAVLVGGAFGVGLSMGGSEESTPQAETEDTQDEEITINPDENDIHEDDNLNDSTDNTETEVSAEVENEYTPVLMDATNPEELIEQLSRNYDCVFNSPILDQQLDCVRYIVGDDASGTLSSSIRDVAFTAQAYRNEVDPDWTYNTERTIVDSSVPANEPITDGTHVIELIIRLDEEDGTQIHKRLNFQRSLAATITEYEDRVERDTTEEFIWLLQSERQVEPGTRLNIG